MFGNLLNKALSIIPKQNFVYCKFKTCEPNEMGIKQNVYEDGITLQGSVQAVRQDMYEKLGLDFDRKYISIHTSADIRNVDNKQPSPDKVIWNNKPYFVVRVTNWYQQDGWVEVIAVEDNNSNEEEE